MLYFLKKDPIDFVVADNLCFKILLRKNLSPENDDFNFLCGFNFWFLTF